MNMIKALLLASFLLFGTGNALAQPAPNPPQTPPNARIRGTITGFDGHALHLKTREGNALSMTISGATKINVLTPLKLRDIKKGSFVGVTAVLRGPGPILQALEVHVFPEAMRGTGEGHYEWDLEPGSTMTNANVDTVVNTNNGKELTLAYKGGSQKIIVPRSAPIITFTPADESVLKPGAHIFIIAQPDADGSMTALRVMVGRDGMKPPM